MKALTVKTSALSAKATAAFAMEHISEDISKNISHIAHIAVFKMVLMITAISTLTKIKTAKATMKTISGCTLTAVSIRIAALFKCSKAILVI